MSDQKSSVKPKQQSRNIHPNVWILGLVSLFTDFGTKAIQSVLPLFLLSVLGASHLEKKQ